MAALAIPLGPLLRSMPPLQAYALGHRRLDGRASPAFTILSGARHAADRLVRRRSRVLARCSAASAPGCAGVARSRPWPLGARSSSSSSRRDARAEIWSPYYRINTVPRRRRRAAHQRQRHPAPGAPPGRRAPKEPFYDQVYDWFPDRTYDEVLIVGAGSGTDVAIALANGAEPRRRGRDRPGDPAARHRVPSRTTRTTTRASPAIENDGRAFLRGTDKQVRPGHLRPARLADARQHDGEHPARVVPVHRARRSRASATTSRPTACSSSTTTTARRG